MRWFFEQAFAVLFSDHMPKTGSKREDFITLGICYIADQQKFIHPIPEVPLKKTHRSQELYDHIAFEYCRSRFGYLFSIHEDEQGVVIDEKYKVLYKGKTYEESKHVILTAVYALKLLEDFCKNTPIDEWVPPWKIDIPQLRQCTTEDILRLTDLHIKKYRMTLILTCMQLSAKIISDDRIIFDKDLAQLFGLKKEEFIALQLRVLDGLHWYLNRTNEQLLNYAEGHHLPDRVMHCISEHEDMINSYYPKIPKHEKEAPSSPETRTIEISVFALSNDNTAAPLRFSNAHKDVGYSNESPNLQSLTERDVRKKMHNKKVPWD